MKILSLVLFTVFFPIIYGIGQNSVQSAINSFAQDEHLKNASISFKVIELGSNTTIASHHEITTLPTASTAKLISTATALEILGPNFRPTTRVYADGAIDTNGVLHGNLWIRGGGDPSIGSKYFNDETNQYGVLEAWVKSLAAKGIKQIDGAIIADASEFGYKGAPDGWNWVDMGNYYGAGPSGLTLFDNLLNIRFKTSGTAGRTSEIVSITPEVPEMVLHNYVQSSTRSGDNAYIYGAPYSLDRFATGTLPVNSNNFLVKGSLPDPEHQFAYEMKKALVASGISVNGGIKTVRSAEIDTNPSKYDAMQLLYSFDGEKLIDVIYHTNMRSVNLFAETMLNLVAYAQSGDGSTDRGLAELERFWSGKFDTKGMQVNDGSGLSRSNAISAANFVDLLRYMHTSKYAADFKNTLPVAGESGTLRNVCKGQSAHGKLLAKSGSMTRIKSYAGYITSSSGKEYAFALIVNNFTCSSSVLRQKMEGIFNVIARY